MPISVEGVESVGNPAQGLSVTWDDGQFVVIVCPRGLVACAAFDIKVMDEFDIACAIAHGSPQNPLVVPEDLMGATISGVSKKASLMGIKKGMLGRQALDIMSRAA